MSPDDALHEALANLETPEIDVDRGSARCTGRPVVLGCCASAAPSPRCSWS